MDPLSLVAEIPTTFWAIVVGSLFTIVGVVLTNAANTKRLRIQHQHEQSLESKNRDLRLRRDTYLAAMEAISAGMVVVGRFGELEVPYRELMQSYTDRSPSVAKVTIVGKNETIKAVATFTQELTGAFLRLTAQRNKLEALWQRSSALGEKIELAAKEQDRLLALMNEDNVAGSHDEQRLNALRRDYERERQRIAELVAEQAEIDGLAMPAQFDLVQSCVREIAALDRLLIPVISLMRAELELPFDEALYAQIVEAGHRKQEEYLEAFIRDHVPDPGEESAPSSAAARQTS